MYLNSSILELKEQVIFHSCSQKQQPTLPTCFDLEWQLEGGDILDRLDGAEAVPKVGFWGEKERCIVLDFNNNSIYHVGSVCSLFCYFIDWGSK